MEFPKDTRNDNKAVHRDNLIFPNTLSSYMPQTDFKNQVNTDIYDRNMFSIGVQNNSYSNNNYNSSSIHSDRNADYSNIHSDRNADYSNVTKYNQNTFSNIPQVTRSKRGEEERISNNNNLYFQNNYENQVNQQINFMDLIPKDTRRSGDKQIDNKNISTIQNRMVGIPFEKIE